MNTYNTEIVRTMPTGDKNGQINYTEYFIIRLKEYLLNLPSDNKFLFFVKILVLTNWNKLYTLLSDSASRVYLRYVKKYLPRLYFYKTHLKRIELTSNKITKIIQKYVTDLPMTESYTGKKNRDGYGLGLSTNLFLMQNGYEFFYNDVYYYCYMDKVGNNPEYMETQYIMECSSNLSREETMTKMNNLFDEISELYINISDSNNAIKIERTVASLFLQQDIEIEMTKFINQYDDMRSEYQKLGMMYKNNFLIYGYPGTGKSTLAKVIANELKRDIVLINLKDIKNSRELQRSVHNNSNSIIVFEELDCLIEKIKSRKDNKKDNMPPKISQYSNQLSRDPYETIVESSDDFRGPMYVKTFKTVEEPDLDLSDFLEILDGM